MKLLLAVFISVAFAVPTPEQMLANQQQALLQQLQGLDPEDQMVLAFQQQQALLAQQAAPQTCEFELTTVDGIKNSVDMQTKMMHCGPVLQKCQQMIGQDNTMTAQEKLAKARFCVFQFQTEATPCCQKVLAAQKAAEDEANNCKCLPEEANQIDSEWCQEGEKLTIAARNHICDVGKSTLCVASYQCNGGSPVTLGSNDQCDIVPTTVNGIANSVPEAMKMQHCAPLLTACAQSIAQLPEQPKNVVAAARKCVFENQMKGSECCRKILAVQKVAEDAHHDCSCSHSQANVLMDGWGCEEGQQMDLKAEIETCENGKPTMCYDQYRCDDGDAIEIGGPIAAPVAAPEDACVIKLDGIQVSMESKMAHCQTLLQKCAQNAGPNKADARRCVYNFQPQGSECCRKVLRMQKEAEDAISKCTCPTGSTYYNEDWCPNAGVQTITLGEGTCEEEDGPTSFCIADYQCKPVQTPPAPAEVVEEEKKCPFDVMTNCAPLVVMCNQQVANQDLGDTPLDQALKMCIFRMQGNSAASDCCVKNLRKQQAQMQRVTKCTCPRPEMNFFNPDYKCEGGNAELVLDTHVHPCVKPGKPTARTMCIKNYVCMEGGNFKNVLSVPTGACMNRLPSQACANEETCELGEVTEVADGYFQCFLKESTVVENNDQNNDQGAQEAQSVCHAVDQIDGDKVGDHSSEATCADCLERCKGEATCAIISFKVVSEDKKRGRCQMYKATNNLQVKPLSGPISDAKFFVARKSMD